MKKMLFVAIPAVLMTAALAQAQLPINAPPAAPPAGTTQGPSTPYYPPSAAAPTYQQPPAVAAPAQPGAVVAPNAGTTVVVPQGSNVIVFRNGARQMYRTGSDYGAVRSFDSNSGRLALQDGNVFNSPENFAFSNVPEVGQPVTVHYYTDQNGNKIVQSIDFGQQNTR